MSRIVVFLGAGASAAEGAPLQQDLFTAYFARDPAQAHPEPAPEVSRFFRQAFAIDLSNVQAGTTFPTFEEVLGLIDLATARGEALRGIPLDGQGPLDLDLRTIRRGLVLVMADAIRRRAPNIATNHNALVTNLREGDRLQETTFVSTNYDVLIDNAIDDHAIPFGDRGVGSVVDHGFGELLPRSQLPGRETRSFPVFKIHGSLSWLHCPVCTDLTVTRGPDVAERLLQDPDAARCTRCDALREPIIVPPTYYKDLSNVFLAAVWNRAARALRQATHLVFCGYSMPDADMHIKYLIKTAQLNPSVAGDAMRITLVNHFADKDAQDVRSELARYSRVFGPRAVTDSGLSFEAFAADPGAIVGRPRG